MIPFSPPHITQAAIDAVINTLKSGWITTGPKTKLFEKELATYCGNFKTLCLNSATAGLEVMLAWYGVGKGDEVILPAYTYTATANVIIHLGATPVFVDVNEHDFNINAHNIKKAITKNTKVIMPVDFAGYPCDYTAINNIVNEPNIKAMFVPASNNQKQLGRIMILSDAAHSIGAIYKGKKTGSLTDVSVFSFHAVKNLTTGEGGAIALNFPEPFNNEAIYNELCIKTLHGQNKDALAKMQKGNWKYDVVEAGYKCNMTDISASIGLVELSRYETEILPTRKLIYETYTSLLRQYNWAILPEYKTINKTTSYHLYPLRIKGINETQRDAIIKIIFDQDVSVNVHFIPVPMLDFYKRQGYNINNYPITYANFASEISLPVFCTLSNDNIHTVVNALVNAVNQIINP